MRRIGLWCVLCSVSTGCIFLESGGGGGGDDVSACDTSILCVEIDPAGNSNAGILAFEGDCKAVGSNYITASCVGGDSVCRNVSQVAGEEQISIIVDFHYKTGYQSATGTDPASDCSNLGGNFEGGGNDDCPNPDFPVYCGAFEGDCWSPGVDCSFPTFDCGGSRWRCITGSDYGACCSDSFVTCASDFPYYCPDDSQCYESPNGECSTASCDFTAADCDGQ